MCEDTRTSRKKQESKHRSAYIADRCYLHLKGLLGQLKVGMDRRLVQTFLSLVMVILIHRHRNQGLLLSELGGYLLDPGQAPAGTKRISRLLHAPRWSSEDIVRYLWAQADRRVEELRAERHTVLAIWDESVIEKPESLQLEGLCAVKSSKAKRLKRIKPGYFNPPGGRPIFVPGYHWLQVLILGMQGAPTLAHMRWWSTRGAQASDRRSQEREVLVEVTQRWESHQVLHVWDRGFAGNPWLTMAFVHAVRFVMRWPKHYKLVDVARPGQGREPWYLLTNEPVHNADDAWRIVLAYARRWQVEMSIRYDKCELAFESPRLRHWETQLRLLLLATLAYSFLLSLLNPDPIDTCSWLLRNWCHRTGEWSRNVQAPLYRLRLAICRLWLTHPPPLLSLIRLSSG